MWFKRFHLLSWLYWFQSWSFDLQLNFESVQYHWYLYWHRNWSEMISPWHCRQALKYCIHGGCLTRCLILDCHSIMQWVHVLGYYFIKVLMKVWHLDCLVLSCDLFSTTTWIESSVGLPLKEKSCYPSSKSWVNKKKNTVCQRRSFVATTIEWKSCQGQNWRRNWSSKLADQTTSFRIKILRSINNKIMIKVLNK